MKWTVRLELLKMPSFQDPNSPTDFKLKVAKLEHFGELVLLK
jgi:hypothetical protein